MDLLADMIKFYIGIVKKWWFRRRLMAMIIRLKLLAPKRCQICGKKESLTECFACNKWVCEECLGEETKGYGYELCKECEAEATAMTEEEIVKIGAEVLEILEKDNFYGHKKIPLGWILILLILGVIICY